MIIAVCFVGAAIGASLVWSSLVGQLSGDRFSRENFRGNRIPAVGGVAVVIVAAGGSLVLFLAVSSEDLADDASLGALLLAIVFGLLGFVDDVAAQKGGGGFRGHLRELGNRRVTTGLVKLAGGVAVAMLVAGLVADDGVFRWARDAALIAGGANLANLFDRAPGRSLKVAVVAFVGLILVAGATETLSFAALGVGATSGIAWWELREEMMLGDTGVNVLGALVGFSAVTTLGSTSLWALLGIVVALNVLSEFVSFSGVISDVAALRAIDQFARRRL